MSSGAHAKTIIRGEIIAGGIILVNTLPGAKVRLDGEEILISDQGIFLLGFQSRTKNYSDFRNTL